MRLNRIKVIVRIALTVALVGGLSSCGKNTAERDRVLDAIGRTQRLPKKFVYADERQKDQVSVVGLVEDDFRLKARVTFNGRTGYDEIISDDTLAVRFADPTRISPLVDRTSLATSDPKTDLEGITVQQALVARRWLVDPVAAPTLTQTARAEKDLGQDPVLDSITALDYVATAVNQALGIRKWSKDDLNPTYPSSEDTFPKPGEGSGVDRYDLVRPVLPPPGAIGAGGQSAVPKTSSFRKMAIYIKGGRVVKVQERVEVTGKGVNTLVTYFRTYLKDQKVSERDRAQFETLVKNTPKTQLGFVLLTSANQFLAASGAQPILIRNMSLDLLALGDKTVKAALPSDGVVHGSLAFLKASGKAKSSAAAAAGGGTGAAGAAGDVTTTTSPGAGGGAATGQGAEATTTTAP